MCRLNLEGANKSGHGYHDLDWPYFQYITALDKVVYSTEVLPMTKRKRHEWDEDACCMHCGLDSAAAHHQRNILRLEIGDDEFQYRAEQGEFDSDGYCSKRD